MGDLSGQRASMPPPGTGGGKSLRNVCAVQEKAYKFEKSLSSGEGAGKSQKAQNFNSIEKKSRRARRKVSAEKNKGGLSRSLGRNYCRCIVDGQRPEEM